MKSKNIILMIAFFALLGFYVAKKTILKPTTRSFKAYLTTLNENDITKITIQPNGKLSNNIDVVKNGETWTVTQNDKTFPTKKQNVDGLVKELSKLKTKQLISKSENKWTEYEVDDQKGKWISIFNGDKLLTKLVVGKFGFNQATRSGVSYARLANEKDVYSLNGFISMSIPKDVNSLRETALVPTQEIQKMDMTIGTEHWTYQLTENGKWEGNPPIDSTKMSQYIQKLSHLNGQKFSTLEQSPQTSSIAKLNLNTKDNKSISIDLYNNPNNNSPFIVKSSINDAFFESDSSGIFKTLVTDWQDLTH